MKDLRRSPTARVVIALVAGFALCGTLNARSLELLECLEATPAVGTAGLWRDTEITARVKVFQQSRMGRGPLQRLLSQAARGWAVHPS